MAANDRLRAQGDRRARKILSELAYEIRDARLVAGLSQVELGARAGFSGDKIWQIEHERLTSLSIADACVVASILGMDLAARLYPNGTTVRDAGQARHLLKLLRNVALPLSYKTDVPLPSSADGRELRAWDVVIYGQAERTGIEFESRLTDVQAMTRRHNLKRRDDPVDHFLLAVADTRHNRRVIAEFADLLIDLPRLRTDTVFRTLAAGRHPSTGLILF